MASAVEGQKLWRRQIRTIDGLAKRIGEVITGSKVFKDWLPEDRPFMVMDALFKSLRKYAGERNRRYGGPMSVFIDASPIVGDTRDPDLSVHIERNRGDIWSVEDLVRAEDILREHMPQLPQNREGFSTIIAHPKRWRSDGSYAMLERHVYDDKNIGIVVRQMKHPARRRLSLLLESTRVRHQGTLARSERTARKKLEKMLDPLQRDCYEVDGSFFEKSSRSGVSYLLRKNRPTLALKIDNEKKTVRFLAALCLHPFGYHDDTWAGVMAPSDEIIAHLLYIRGDEHGLWKSANHIPLTSSRSGV